MVRLRQEFCAGVCSVAEGICRRERGLAAVRARLKQAAESGAENAYHWDTVLS